MTFRKIFFFVSLIFSVLCLATGYGIAGQWIGVAIAIITGSSWLLARKYPTSWLPFMCLLASIFLAVMGTLLGSPPWLMIFGSGIALAVWDLLFLNDALGSNSPGEQTRHYENIHLQSLALALGSGLLLAVLGHSLNLQIPFVMLMFFIALAVYGLDRIWGYIKKSH
jgi:hypothetical protein